MGEEHFRRSLASLGDYPLLLFSSTAILVQPMNLKFICIITRSKSETTQYNTINRVCVNSCLGPPEKHLIPTTTAKNLQT
jgi:hypothetical protein